MVVVAAWVFVAIALFVVGFQVALVAGAPWGHLTQGGQRTGALPVANRVAAGVSAVLLVVLAAVVLVRSGVAQPAWLDAARPWAWVVVGFSVLTVLANAATRSRAERALWLPVGVAMLATSLVVALSST